MVFGWLAELETVRSLIIFMTVFSAFLQPFFPCLIAVLCQEILIMCDKVDKPRKPAFIMAASSYLKGAFNNYVDQILPNFDHLPLLEWMIMDILNTHFDHESKRGFLLTTYLLTSSSHYSLQMPLFLL